MKKHFVYFYGSTKIISGPNSLSEDNIRLRNQIIGFEGIDMNPELVEFGEKCLNAVNPEEVLVKQVPFIQTIKQLSLSNI
jgi:hypothetical protein